MPKSEFNYPSERQAPAKSQLPGLTPGESKVLARMENHQKLEELKVTVLEKAQRNLDLSINVLRSWMNQG